MARRWRKRVGVEPTKDRLSAPSGFEVRTSHRGRISSRNATFVGNTIRHVAEEIQTAAIDAAEIATARGHAMTVEEIEDLDRDLATVFDPGRETASP